MCLHKHEINGINLRPHTLVPANLKTKLLIRRGSELTLASASSRNSHFSTFPLISLSSQTHFFCLHCSRIKLPYCLFMPLVSFQQSSCFSDELPSFSFDPTP